MKHYLKTLPIYFERVVSLKKNFEVRKNDRDFQTGDIVVLQEWSETDKYTGREIGCMVEYILYDFEGLVDGYVALGLSGNKNFNFDINYEGLRV